MDELKPTPRNKLLGLLSDSLKGGLDAATQNGKYKGINFLADLTGLPDIQKMAERLSYGGALTTGGGLNTRLHPEIGFGALSALPFVGLAAKPTAKLLSNIELQGSKAMPARSKASPMADRGAIGNFSGNAYYETPEVHQKKISDLYRAFGNFGNSQSGMSPQTARSLYEKGLLKASKKETDLLLDMTDASGAIRPQATEQAAGNEHLLKILERNGESVAPKFPQSEALDLAQKRAALPISENGLANLLGWEK